MFLIDKDENEAISIVEFLECIDFEEIMLNTGNQRMILIAANFRHEVTSAIMWLTEYGIDIKCIKATSYKHDNNIFLAMANFGVF